jgi:hypothetical protein
MFFSLFFSIFIYLFIPFLWWGQTQPGDDPKLSPGHLVSFYHRPHARHLLGALSAVFSLFYFIFSSFFLGLFQELGQTRPGGGLQTTSWLFNIL